MSVFLSDNERARRDRDQIPVLLGDLVQKSGWRREGAACFCRIRDISIVRKNDRPALLSVKVYLKENHSSRL